jgi:hypothetical protein
MDFSQYIKNIQSKAVWVDYESQVLKKQATYNNTSPLSTLNTATYTYKTYEAKDLIAQGRFATSTVNVYTTEK